ncbi:MAG: hypothetical protein WD077_11415 [Bacteroidia bacterium]
MKKLMLYCLPLLIVFASCKKDKDGDDLPQIPETACYITSQKIVGSSYDTYEYDDDDNLVTINHEGPSGSIGRTEYIWENGQNVKISRYTAANDLVYFYDIKYTDGEVSSAERNDYIPRDSRFGVTEKDTIVSENGKIKEYYTYINFGTEWRLRDYTIIDYDANGNGIKRTRYDSGDIMTGITELDVDNAKKSPQRFFETALVVPSKNLATEVRTYGPMGGLETTTIVTVEEENEHNYPLDMTSKQKGSSSGAQVLYTYNCK